MIKNLLSLPMLDLHTSMHNVKILTCVFGLLNYSTVKSLFKKTLSFRCRIEKRGLNLTIHMLMYDLFASVLVATCLSDRSITNRIVMVSHNAKCTVTRLNWPKCIYKKKINSRVDAVQWNDRKMNVFLNLHIILPHDRMYSYVEIYIPNFNFNKMCIQA